MTLLLLRLSPLPFLRSLPRSTPLRWHPPTFTLTHTPLRRSAHSPAATTTTTTTTTMTIPQSSTDWASEPTGSFKYYTKPIQKSPQDDREYRLIRLENGLEAMLVHDPKADKAAASLDVAVGHLHDPDDMPGLAHFCEHLLFMGTEQYPGENEYSEYLSKNNGFANAYTSTSNTNYFFTVSTNALSGALTRFSCFFHSPLFSPSCTARELNAVDSEHQKNHQNDIWRIFQVTKYLSKPGHVWSKFGSGNRDSLSKVGRELKAQGLLKNNTGASANGAASPAEFRSPDGSLAVTPQPSRVPSPAPSSSSGSAESEGDGGVVGRETRRRLVEWWSKEYSANRMRLCVIGKEPLEELSQMVSKLFSPIVDRGIDPLPMINDHPFGPDEMGTLVSVQTVMSFHAIELSFPFPYQAPYWRHQPGYFLGHFIGHEGPGSLHSYLKHKGWIIALNAGPQTLARGFGHFKITLRLTKSGFDHWRDVCLAVFKYLALLKTSDLPGWCQAELATIKKTRFRFAEKRRPEDYALWITDQMAWPVPRDLVLSAPQVVSEWDSEDPMKEGGGEREVREMLDCLSVRKGRTILMAREEEFDRLKGEQRKWDIEPWYETQYTVEEYDEAFVKEADSPNDIKDLFLPGPNEFIPTNLDVDKRDVDQPGKRPHLIRETALSSLWHKKDDQFWVPRAQVIVDIRSPVANESARASVMTRLYSELVTDSLTEFSYDADLAGLNYTFGSQNLGVFVTLNGYNDKLHVLAHHVFEKARRLHIVPERLAAKKEEIKRDWENFFLDQPYRVSDYYAKYVFTEKDWTLVEKVSEIASITPEDLRAHVERLLSRVHIRLLVVGNMYKDEAIRLAETIEQTVQASPIPADEVVDLSLHPEPRTNYILSSPVPNPNEPNSSLTYYLHVGSSLDPHLRVTSSLVTQILSEPAFNVLRTREQLGYIVMCSEWQLCGGSQRGVRIAVQSERVPTYLEERVEAFLEEMKVKIKEMEEGEFEEQRKGLETKWREKVKNMSEETNRYWTHVDSGHMDFLRRDTNVEILQTVTKSDVLDFFMKYLHPSSPTRAKISIHLRSRKPRAKKISVEGLTAIEELISARLEKLGGPTTPSTTTTTTKTNGNGNADSNSNVEGGEERLPSIANLIFPEGWKNELVSDNEVTLDSVLAFLKTSFTSFLTSPSPTITSSASTTTTTTSPSSSSSSSPASPYVSAKAALQASMTDPSAAKELADTINALAEKYPAASQSEGKKIPTTATTTITTDEILEEEEANEKQKKSNGNGEATNMNGDGTKTIIPLEVFTDPHVLKKRLTLSERPVPVVEWGDLPTAKF